MLPKAVIFDKDGTLIDSEPIEEAVTNNVLKELGYEFDPMLDVELVGRPVVDSLRIFRQVYGSNFPTETYLESREKHRNRVRLRSSNLFSGAVELLDYLKSARVPMAVATSADRNTARRDLAECGILDYFSTVITIDDVEIGKPHPETYLKAAECLNVLPSDCVAVEDSAIGVESAANAGLVVICLSSTSDRIVRPVRENEIPVSLTLPNLKAVTALLKSASGLY